MNSIELGFLAHADGRVFEAAELLSHDLLDLDREGLEVLFEALLL